MFSIFKKAAVAQESVLQDLSESQLSQVAGGNCSSYKSSNDHDADDMRKKKKHHHHHHYHKHASWCKSNYNGSCNCSMS